MKHGGAEPAGAGLGRGHGSGRSGRSRYAPRPGVGPSWSCSTRSRLASRAACMRLSESIRDLPPPIWFILGLGAALTMGSPAPCSPIDEEAHPVEGSLIAAIAALVTAGLLLVWFLDHPYDNQSGSIEPTEMRTSVAIVEDEQLDVVPPCDSVGAPSGVGAWSCSGHTGLRRPVPTRRPHAHSHLLTELSSASLGFSGISVSGVAISPTVGRTPRPAAPRRRGRTRIARRRCRRGAVAARRDPVSWNSARRCSRVYGYVPSSWG